MDRLSAPPRARRRRVRHQRAPEFARPLAACATRIWPRSTRACLRVHQRLREKVKRRASPVSDSIALWARTGTDGPVSGPHPTCRPPARCRDGRPPDRPCRCSRHHGRSLPSERTGRGTMVATSCSQWALDERDPGARHSLRTRTECVRPARTRSAPSPTLPLPDGRWFMLTITGDERHWESFAAGDRARGPQTIRASRPPATGARMPAPSRHSRRWFPTKDWRHGRRFSRRRASRSAWSATLDDVPHDAQMRASGALVPIDDPRAGASLTVSSRCRSAISEGSPTLAPEIGQHTVEGCRRRITPAGDRTTPAGWVSFKPDRRPWRDARPPQRAEHDMDLGPISHRRVTRYTHPFGYHSQSTKYQEVSHAALKPGVWGVVIG